MKLRFVLGISCVCALLLAAAWGQTPANATTTDPRLDAAASRIAGHPIQVLCYERGEDLDPYAFYGAWGYVYAWDHEYENMAAEVCDGALAIANHDPAVPLWEQAVGAWVITHESFHQRLDLSDRINEAKTECRAIRHFMYTVRFLGGSAQLALELQPYALAAHYRIAEQYPVYDLKNCDVPWWWH